MAQKARQNRICIITVIEKHNGCQQSTNRFAGIRTNKDSMKDTSLFARWTVLRHFQKIGQSVDGVIAGSTKRLALHNLLFQRCLIKDKRILIDQQNIFFSCPLLPLVEFTQKIKMKNKIHFGRKFSNAIQAVRIHPRQNQVVLVEKCGCIGCICSIAIFICKLSLCSVPEFDFCWLRPFVQIFFLVRVATIHFDERFSQAAPDMASNDWTRQTTATVWLWTSFDDPPWGFWLFFIGNSTPWSSFPAWQLLFIFDVIWSWNREIRSTSLRRCHWIACTAANLNFKFLEQKYLFKHKERQSVSQSTATQTNKVESNQTCQHHLTGWLIEARNVWSPNSWLLSLQMQIFKSAFWVWMLVSCLRV